MQRMLTVNWHLSANRTASYHCAKAPRQNSVRDGCGRKCPAGGASKKMHSSTLHQAGNAAEAAIRQDSAHPSLAVEQPILQRLTEEPCDWPRFPIMLQISQSLKMGPQGSAGV